MQRIFAPRIFLVPTSCRPWKRLVRRSAGPVLAQPVGVFGRTQPQEMCGKLGECTCAYASKRTCKRAGISWFEPIVSEGVDRIGQQPDAKAQVNYRARDGLVAFIPPHGGPFSSSPGSPEAGLSMCRRWAMVRTLLITDQSRRLEKAAARLDSARATARAVRRVHCAWASTCAIGCDSGVNGARATARAVGRDARDLRRGDDHTKRDAKCGRQPDPPKSGGGVSKWARADCRYCLGYLVNDLHCVAPSSGPVGIRRPRRADSFWYAAAGCALVIFKIRGGRPSTVQGVRAKSQ
jgi:hypothetical protein